VTGERSAGGDLQDRGDDGARRSASVSLGVQDPLDPWIALVDDHVLVAAVRMEEVMPHVVRELSPALDAAAAAGVGLVFVLLGCLLAREELVLGVRLAGLARLTAMGRLVRSAAVVVRAFGGQLVDSLAVSAALGEGPRRREAEGRRQRACRRSGTREEAATRGALSHCSPLAPAARPGEPLNTLDTGF
jgi:hypothetical protein